MTEKCFAESVAVPEVLKMYKCYMNLKSAFIYIKYLYIEQDNFTT